jgi:hypothetical protein
MEELTKYDKAKKRFTEIKRHLFKLENEIDDIRNENEILRAKLIKELWSSKDYEKFEYNSREKIRQADLVLKLNSDSEYKNKLKRIRDLEAERGELQIEQMELELEPIESDDLSI